MKFNGLYKLLIEYEEDIQEKYTEKQQDYVVVYSGRFQPFHNNHYKTYKDLVNKFGDNVYIATSNKTVPNKSPFNFKEKHKIITTMFKDIPKDKVVQIKNPYNPQEILSKFDDDTVYIAAVGEKDSKRLGGKYFEKYEDGREFKGYKEQGYTYINPLNTLKYNGEIISGTSSRENLGSNEETATKFFNTIYPKFNKDIFNLIRSKILWNF